MTVTVYRAPWSTNCERVAIALAAKGLEAESVLIEYSDRTPVERISDQPLVPVIVDEGEVISDSVAIIRHLEARHPEPPLLPPPGPRRAELEVFIEWFERVYKLAPNEIEAELSREAPDGTRIAMLSREMAARLELLEALLEGREFLLGAFGAADCIAYPFLKYAAARDPADDELFHLILERHQPLGENHPNLAAWIKRVGRLPHAF